MAANGKKSSPYTLVREPIESNKVYSLYNARNKETGEFWLAKVFDNNIVQQLQMMDHVEYNEEVLQNLREKENVIYVPQIFVKGNQTYLIEEKYQTRLSEEINKKVTLPPIQIERILKDVFKGVCDIYEEQYIHRNLRSDQIVKVQGNSPNQYSWKIESLVLDNKEFPIITPFTWNRQSASPEDDPEAEMEQEHQDAQIVWNFGYLAMEMLKGTTFMKKKAGKDSDIPWAKIKEQTSPELFQLIDKCYRQKFKDRISLRKFFQLKIFQKIVRPGITDYFLMASKIFKTETFSKIQSSIQSKGMKSMRFQPSKVTKKSPVKGETYFNSIQQVNEQVYDESGNKDATRFCFLVEINKYLNLIASLSEKVNMKSNRVVIDFFFLKLALKFEERARKGKHPERLDDLRRESQSKISNQSKLIKNIKEKECQLLQKFQLNFKKDYSLEELIDIFNKLNGYAYSRIQEQLQIKEAEEAKLRALSYFGLLAYIINVNDWTDLETLRGSAHTEYISLFESTSTDALIKFTQTLIKKYFEEA